MQDVVPELLERIQKDFEENYNKSKLINSLYQKVRDGTATYLEANDYAIEVGKLLSNAYQKNLSSDVLPDGHMYYNIANRIITPTMEYNHELISAMANMVQSDLNELNGFGIKAITPDVNSDRIKGIIEKVVSVDQFDDVKWVLSESVVNFSQNVVAETIKTNAEFHYDSGIEGKIIRKSTGKCCEWCNRLAGVYIYPDVPDDVYRRHDYCRCTVDYTLGDSRSNVHNNNTGKRRYVQDKYGNYVKSKDARIQHAKEMAATEEERKDAARKKRIDTWKIKNEARRIQLSEQAEDITDEFLKFSKPRAGHVINGDVLSHKEETETATWVVKKFGGDITLLKESLIDGIKTPDFLWNNKAWELKNVSTKTSVDNQIHKAVKQLFGDEAGIILDIKNRKISEEEIIDAIIERSAKRAKITTKVIIKDGDRLVKIIEVKNKDRQT